MNWKTIILRMCVTGVALALSLLISSWLIILVTPHISDISIDSKGQREPVTNTFFFNDKQTLATISFNLEIHHNLVTVFRILADDCLDELRINDRPVADVQFCGNRKIKDVDLEEYLSLGANRVTALVRNFEGEGNLHFYPSYTNLWFSAIHIFCLLLFILIFATALRPLWKKWGRGLLAIFGLGCILRIFYVLQTHYLIRSLDEDGHIAYLLHVLKTFRIPEPQTGWQMYQPPTYYFLSALTGLPAWMMSGNTEVVLHIIQWQSCLLAIAALLAGIWTGTLLFFEERNNVLLRIFAVFLACFPLLILQSSILSNDSFMVLIFFLTLGFLIRFWQQNQIRYWYLCLVIICIGILTKSTAIPLLPAAFATVFLAKEIPLRRKILHGAIGLAVTLAITGWYAYLQIAVHNQAHIMGNIGQISQDIYIKNWKWTNFFVFRPHEILANPYYDPWTDTHTRPYLWEVLTITALLGENNVGDGIAPLVRIIHAINFVFLAFGITGAALCIKKAWYEHLPLFIISATTILAMMALVTKIHIGGLQHFRYVTVLTIPAAYFSVRGLSLLPGQWRFFRTTLVCVHAFLLILLIILITRYSP